MWFRIQRVTGTQTTLETPTAVAAIRGTEGTQDVPNDNQSTHALTEGEEQITEVVTQQSVTIRTGQRVTAIRGVGFTPVVALIAALTQPLVAGGTPPPPPAANPGGIAPGLSTAGANAGAATASSITTVAAVSATAAASGVVAATVPVAARTTPTASESNPTALNPPGGR
jgi:hypothetical protein